MTDTVPHDLIQWLEKLRADPDGFKPYEDTYVDGWTDACNRAIEAVIYFTQPKPTDSTARNPAHSLVKRVAAQIENGIVCDREPDRIARTAISEIIAYLQKNSADTDWVNVAAVVSIIANLKEEVER